MSDEIAIAHKHYPERGGAEIVADELARTFDAPVYTGYDRDASADDVQTRELWGDGWLNTLIAAEYPYHHLARDLWYIYGWSHQPDTLGQYDTIIQSGCSPMWYVPTDEQTIVRYIHSTPRTPYDLHQNTESRLQRLYSIAARVATPSTVPFAERYVANSDLVADRLQRYWGVDESTIDVVYPPVDVANYQPRAGDGEYYLLLSRLAHHKGIHLAIDAFKQLPEQTLVIAGDGPERDTFEQRASGHSNIEFEGYVSDERKRQLFEQATASIFPAQQEDFGIVPIESMAAGTPVIGVNEGFTQHQITPGGTGLLFDRGSAGLQRAIREFERDGVSATADELHAFAQRFSRDRFRKEMHAVVDNARKTSQVEAPWEQGHPDTDALDNADTLTAAMTDGGAADE